ncbi:MAG: MerC family mercury resistance protein [Myxococcota bacterium]
MTRVALDQLGGVASATCALHCVVMSFAPALLPLLGLGVLAGEAFEWGFFALAVVVALAAAALGSREPKVLAGFAAGIGVLLAGRLGEAFGLVEGPALPILGGTILVATHVLSARRTLACREPCCD